MGRPEADLVETLRGPGDLAGRVDRLLGLLGEMQAELLELRAEIAEQMPPAGGQGFQHGTENLADDFSEAALIDTHSAASRFGYPVCTLARWAREGDGVKRGGRWLVSVPRLRARLRV